MSQQKLKSMKFFSKPSLKSQTGPSWYRYRWCLTPFHPQRSKLCKRTWNLGFAMQRVCWVWPWGSTWEQLSWWHGQGWKGQGGQTPSGSKRRYEGPQLHIIIQWFRSDVRKHFLMQRTSHMELHTTTTSQHHHHNWSDGWRHLQPSAAKPKMAFLLTLAPLPALCSSRASLSSWMTLVFDPPHILVLFCFVFFFSVLRLLCLFTRLFKVYFLVKETFSHILQSASNKTGSPWSS